MYIFKRQISSDLSEAMACTKQILKILSNIYTDQELLFNIRLILDELVANGLKHGNEFDKDKKLQLKIKIINGNIFISVKDEGRGINYKFTDYKMDFHKSCGRGLFIVKKLSDDVIIRENEVIAILEGANN